MSYNTVTFRVTGNAKMAKQIKDDAKGCNLHIVRMSSPGWMIKDISITVFGYQEDIDKFENKLPDGVQS